MKKMYLILGGIVIAAAIVTFGIVSWNDKIEKASESAKQKIEIVKKTNPDLTGDAPLSSINDGKSANEQHNGDDRVDDDGTVGNRVSGSRGDSQHDSGEISENSKSNDVPKSIAVEQVQSGAALADIKAAYYKAFSEQEVLEGSKVDQVVVQAKADYVSGKYSKEDLLVKYQEIALSLEAQADQVFDAIYQQLEYDLEKNGHDVSEAVIYRNEYERKKGERLSQVINELSEF